MLTLRAAMHLSRNSLPVNPEDRLLRLRIRMTSRGCLDDQRRTRRVATSGCLEAIDRGTETEYVSRAYEKREGIEMPEIEMIEIGVR
jgi:hypothetical protein